MPSPEPSALQTLDDHGLLIQRLSPGRGNPEGPSRLPPPCLASARQVRLQLAELAPRTCRSTPDPFSWQEAGSSAFGKMFLRPWFGTMSRPCSWPPVGSRQDLPSPHQIHHPGIPGPSPKLCLLPSSSEKEDSRSRGDSEDLLGLRPGPGKALSPTG